MSDSFHKSEDLWSSYKLLKKIVWNNLSDENPELKVSEFENILRKHKQTFFSLLQNPPKNAKSREELRKGMDDGITIKDLGHQILSKELYQESVIISEMFDVNEFVALDLLCTAQIQMSFYPGLPRGLVAILLYYDGRKSIVLTLRCLIQARKGIQWSLNLRQDVEDFITNYTDQLLEAGLFGRIFELLRTLDYTKEVEKLQENLALGGARHRRQVSELFKDIRSILAECIFLWATQSGLPRKVTVELIHYLQNAKLEEESTGRVDTVNLYLLMALLAALDLSVLHSREDGEEAVESLPLIADPDFITAVIAQFTGSKPKWACEGLQAVSTFGLAVCIASLRLLPENQKYQEALAQEEDIIDAAIELNVFEFLHDNLLENEVLYKETFLYKRMHFLLTDFIVNLYPKVRELRTKSDEIARTVQVYTREGLEAPGNLPRYFEHLLLAVAKFYGKDKLDTDYILCFWDQASSARRDSTRAVTLHKFLRLAGDILPPTLFVPYLTMLAGLSSTQQSARNCFNMLKQITPQTSAQLSWDHFFLSFAQYYNNLRQETPLVSDTVYRNSFLRGVSPQELDGLHAVLRLIRAVAENDEFSRLALCEHPGWAPLTVLLGLVGCAVPIPLKAELLLTLTALAKSGENAAQMWENLETTQVLATIPTTSSYTPRGIQTELDEIESRMEEYPLTGALLRLLDVLTDFGIPRTLGAGPRKPGFDPYLSFILNSVFLKFNSRAYRNPLEKWELACICLKLFDKFLATYDPQVLDFPRKNQPSEFNPPPGYHLMVQLNNKSEFLNVILDIVDESVRFFDTYLVLPNFEAISDSVFYCLRIIYVTLGLQAKFDHVLAASQASLLLTHLNKLLLTINRRSGKPDHCLNIAKYVSYNPYLQKHGLLAVKILNFVTTSSVLHNQFIKIFLSSDVRLEIRQGFVLCLDQTIEEDDEFVLRTKLEIFKLLKQSLAYNAPNFAHYLLGFDLRKDISKMEFQHSGVMDSPRCCLHSIISLMEYEASKPRAANSGLLAHAYEVIYLLASNEKSYGPVLRYLRLNKHFFQSHLERCAKRLGDDVHVMGQMAWLMKIIAIELKICGLSRQVSYLKHITNFLVSLPNLHVSTNQDPFSVVYKEKPSNEVNHIFLEKISNNFMIGLIPHFRYDEMAVEEPQWQFFDGKVLNALIESCVRNKLIDLKKLHQKLYEEVKQLHGTAVLGQIQAVSEEIPKVLKYALELNKNKERYASLVHFVDGWCQIMEVLVLCMPKEILSVKESQFVGICTASKLLNKVIVLYLLPEVGQLLSSALVVIFDNLQKLNAFERKEPKFINVPLSATIIDMNHDSLKNILENLIEWILVANTTDEKLRVNLYTSLLTILNLTNFDRGVRTEVASGNSMYVSRLDNSRVLAEEHRARFSLNSFPRFGEMFMDAMCKDCIGGYDVPKMLALSCFGTLIQISGDSNWILHMSGRGYLKYVIQSIADSNADLERILEPSQMSVKCLYIYTSKMAFLGQLARNRQGATLLLELKLLAAFGNMNVFSYHPEVSPQWRAEPDCATAPDEVYLQLWTPTLELCNAILTTLGTENQSAVVQILYFLLSHLDVVETVLRAGCAGLSRPFLKELATLTSLLARCANNNLVGLLECPETMQNSRAQLYRLQKLTLALLPKFLLNEENAKDLVNRPQETSHTFQTSERLLYAMEIMGNLLAYARNTVENHDVEHAGVGVIFEPNLKDTGLHLYEAKGVTVNFNERAPSLGVIVQQLINTVNYHRQEKLTCDTLYMKLHEVPDMDMGAIDELLDKEMIMQDVNVKREIVYDLLLDRLTKKGKEIDYCYFMIENAIYLIWVHLDYYMLKAIPRVRNFGTVNTSMNLNTSLNTTLASASEATWKVSTDDISNLKADLVSIFNGRFTKQLIESVQHQSDLDRRFVETMLEKINRLIQFVPVK